MVTTGYPTDTIPLGDIPVGQEAAATWSITKTSLLPPEDGYSWPTTLTLEAANADTITTTDAITVEKIYDSGYEVSLNAYSLRNDPDDPAEGQAPSACPSGYRGSF